MFRVGAKVVAPRDLMQRGWIRPIKAGTEGIVLYVSAESLPWGEFCVYTVRWTGNVDTQVMNAHLLLDEVSP